MPLALLASAIVSLKYGRLRRAFPMTVAQRLRDVARRILRGHNTVKRGEIKHDEFYYFIERAAARPDVKAILEIGASTGDGSTEALTLGMSKNPSVPVLYSIEAIKDRFDILQRRYAANPS